MKLTKPQEFVIKRMAKGVPLEDRFWRKSDGTLVKECLAQWAVESVRVRLKVNAATVTSLLGNGLIDVGEARRDGQIVIQPWKLTEKGERLARARGWL